MGSTEERHASFHKWPMHIKLLPISMAAAGFYHSNKRTNTVTCFSCSSILKNNQGPAAYDGGGIIIEGYDPERHEGLCVASDLSTRRVLRNFSKAESAPWLMVEQRTWPPKTFQLYLSKGKL